MGLRNRNWLFGTKAGLNFSTVITPFAGAPINTIEGCASISDAVTGNLLFQCDGTQIIDAAGNVRATGLLGNHSSTQAAVIVPDPSNPKKYYVFTSDGPAHHVACYHVNTVPWGPVTPVTLGAPTTGFSPTEKLVAVLHGNQHDFWVLAIVQSGTALGNGIGPGVLRVFLVTNSGVAWHSDQPLGQNVDDVGHLKASLGGRRLAIVNFGLVNILVIPFSSSSGTTSGVPLVIHTNATLPHVALCPYGAEFSQTGELLYFTVLYPFTTAINSPVTDSLLYQYPLPNGPRLLLGAHPRSFANGSSDACALQYGPDGRIYIAHNADTKLGIIAHPDVAGPGCGLAFTALPLAPTAVCRSGLPNFVRELF